MTEIRFEPLPEIAVRYDEAARRLDELERRIHEGERSLLHDVDTSPRPGDPPQPTSQTPTREEDVLELAPLTSARLVARAGSRLGYTESATGDSEFGRWYGVNPANWCAMFVSWVFYTEDLPLPARTAKGFSYCGDGIKWLKARGRWGGGTVRAQPGWVVFYDWSDTAEPYDHVGIVQGVNDNGSIRAIEGNTKNPATGRDRPRGVCLKNRAVGILGYGIPIFADGGTQEGGDPLAQLPLLVEGKRGRDVRRLQGLLRAADAGLTNSTFDLNGTFDATTLAEVEKMQQRHHLDTDGEVGPKTWRALLGLPQGEG